MADFRRLLYAFAIVALLVGITVPASAQSVLMTCTGSANNPLIRGEDYTAMTGDIFVQCTGGIPTSSTFLVPKVDITVFTTTSTITSKLTDSSAPPNTNFNEVLLVIDEAGSAAPSGLTFPLLNCGNATAPYSLTPFSCDILGSPTSNGLNVYDGSSNRPNVFQGRQVSTSAGTAIQFLGIPLDAAPTSGTNLVRTMRITNLRVDATRLGIFGNTGSFTNAFINMTVNFNGTNFGGQQVINVVTGTVRGGLVVTKSSDNSYNVNDYLQCTARSSIGKRSINLTEGFSTAFKVRNWKQIQDNGTFLGSDWSPSGTTVYSSADIFQNVPNALYNTESGLMFPSTAAAPAGGNNPPPGTGSSYLSPGGTPFFNVQGIEKAGTVTQGTRFYLKFGAVPGGSNPSIPNVVRLRSNSVTTGYIALVLGADANGAGGAPAGTSGGIPTIMAGACTAGCTTISSLSGGMAVYEVIFSNPSAIEAARIDVYTGPTVALTASPSTPEVGPAALTATAGFAPFYPSGVNGVNNARQMTSTATSVFNSSDGSTTYSYPIPRFIDNQQGAVTFYDYSKCACDLLFPWVVGDSTFTTSIVIANTSLDPCNGALLTIPSGTCSAGFLAAPQSGKVTFWYFGTVGISTDPTTPISTQASQTSTVSVPAGSYLAHIVSPGAAGTTTANGLNKLSANFAGYVIAQAQFQYCHGIAAIGSSLPGFGTQTYIGLTLDKGNQVINGTITQTEQGTSFSGTIGSGRLPRTVQSSDDGLEH